MNKNDFLNRLKEALRSLPPEDAGKTLDYYAEIIEDATEDGEDEQAVIAKLGDVNEIAQKIINETPLSKIVKTTVRKQKPNAGMIILLILSSPVWLSFLLAAIAVVLSVYLSLWAIILCFWVIFASLILSGIASLLLTPILIPVRPAKAMFFFGTSLLCIGLSVFTFYLSAFLSRCLIRLTKLTVKKCFVKGGTE